MMSIPLGFEMELQGKEYIFDIPDPRFPSARFLGQGVYGSVFAATDRDSGSSVAVKVVSVHNKEKLQEFEDEVNAYRTFNSLCNHFFVPLINYGVIQIEGVYRGIMIQPLMDGDLTTLIMSGENTLHVLYMVFQTLIEGIYCLHKNGFVHRDIKLENILFRGDVIQISDLGFACSKDVPGIKFCPVDNVGTRNVLGTWPSPDACEHLQSITMDTYKALDVWAMGIALFGAVYKRLPFKVEINSCEAIQRLRQEDIEESDIGDDIGPVPANIIDTIINGCLKIKYSSRLSIEAIYDIFRGIRCPQLGQLFSREDILRILKQISPEKDFGELDNRTLCSILQDQCIVKGRRGLKTLGKEFLKEFAIALGENPEQRTEVLCKRLYHVITTRDETSKIQVSNAILNISKNLTDREITQSFFNLLNAEGAGDAVDFNYLKEVLVNQRDVMDMTIDEQHKASIRTWLETMNTVVEILGKPELVQTL